MNKFISLFIIVVSVILIIVGLSFGNIEEGILQKAINICYECIGIG